MASRRTPPPAKVPPHPLGGPATPIRTEGVGGPPLPPSDAVTALRVVGRDFVLRLPREKATYTLGSAPPSEVDLSLRLDGASGVSRLHAIIQRVDNWLKISDHSTNGLYYAGRKEKTVHIAAGGRFDVDDVPLLALDDHLDIARATLHRFLGYGDILAVDLATEAIASDNPLMIAGARGSEHELLARAIHEASGRRVRRFELISVRETVAQQKAKIARAGRGTVYVDTTGGTLTKQVVDFLFSPDYAVRPIFGTLEQAALRDGLGGALWGQLREIPIPAVSSRRHDITHLFNALFVEAKSERRLEDLPRDQLHGVCSFDWPENLADIRRNAERVLAYLSHATLADAARSLGVKTPSLHEALARIQLITPKR